MRKNLQAIGNTSLVRFALIPGPVQQLMREEREGQKERETRGASRVPMTGRLDFNCVKIDFRTQAQRLCACACVYSSTCHCHLSFDIVHHSCMYIYICFFTCGK